MGARSLAVIHRQGHQKGDNEPATGNGLADQAAREAAQNGQLAITAPVTSSLQNPTYTAAENSRAKTEGAIQHPQGGGSYLTSDCSFWRPSPLMWSWNNTQSHT